MWILRPERKEMQDYEECLILNYEVSVEYMNDLSGQSY